MPQPRVFWVYETLASAHLFIASYHLRQARASFVARKSTKYWSWDIVCCTLVIISSFFLSHKAGEGHACDTLADTGAIVNNYYSHLPSLILLQLWLSHITSKATTTRKLANTLVAMVKHHYCLSAPGQKREGQKTQKTRMRKSSRESALNHARPC